MGEPNQPDGPNNNINNQGQNNNQMQLANGQFDQIIRTYEDHGGENLPSDGPEKAGGLFPKLKF